MSTRRLFVAPSAASRIAAARAFALSLAPGARFGIVGHARFAAARLRQEICAARGALAGVRAESLWTLVERFGAPVLAKRGLTRLIPRDRKLMLAMLVESGAKVGSLGRFRDAARAPGLPGRFGKTFDELRLARIPPAKLSEHDGTLGGLFEVWERALEKMKRADRTEELACATIGVGERGVEAFAGEPLVLLDVPIRSTAVEEFVGALVHAAPATFATAPAGDRVSAEALLRLGCRATDLPDGARDAAGSPTAPDIARVQRFLFRGRASPHDGNENRGDPATSKAVEWFVGPSETLEAAEGMRRIAAAAREGIPFDRMAVLLSDPNRYARRFEDAARRARIPFVSETGPRWRLPPSARAFFLLLDCAAENLSADRFAEYLSLGEFPDLMEDEAADDDPTERPSDADDLEPEPEDVQRLARELEGHVLESRVLVGLDRWRRRLDLHVKALRTAEESAVRAYDRRNRSISDDRWKSDDRWNRWMADDRRMSEDDPTGARRAMRRRRTAERLRDFALPLLERLDALPTEATWDVWREALVPVAERGLRRPESVRDCLASPPTPNEDRTWSAAAMRAELRRALRVDASPPRPRRDGRIWITSIERARGLSFDIVLLPGCAERAFPRTIREDPILLDRTRTAVSDRLPVRSHRVEEERLLLRLAAGAAQKRLIVSYAGLDAGAVRQTVPSFYFGEIVQAATGRNLALAELRTHAAEGSDIHPDFHAPNRPENALDRGDFDLAMLARAFRNVDSARQVEGAGAYLIASDPAIARGLRQEWQRSSRKWTAPDGFLKPGDEARKALRAHLPDIRSYSATGLETYAACPYRFFLRNIARIEAPERPERLVAIDPLQRGSFLHEVFFRMGRILADPDADRTFRDNHEAAVRRLNEEFDAVARRFEEENAPVEARIFMDQMDGLRADASEWLIQALGDGFRGVAHEFTFGMEPRGPSDPDSTAEPARLPIGLWVRGSIDLVEKGPDDQIRITDFKTGGHWVSKSNWSAPPVAVSGGRMLQPLLYAMAWEEITGERVTGARLYYSTFRGGFGQTVVGPDELHGDAGPKFAAALRSAIESGRFPAHPDPNAKWSECGSCDFLSICGPRPESYRTSKADAREAVALAEATAIRNLP